MPTVAVTRMGYGRLYAYATRLAADESPLVQYGDAILSGPKDVERQYNELEIELLYSHLGQSDKANLYIARQKDQELHPAVRKQMRWEACVELWELCVEKALPAPTEPEVVCALVTEDRRATRTTDPREKLKMARRNAEASATDTPNETVENSGATTDAAPKAERKPRGPVGTMVIRLLNDKEGKQYGSDNNPKKTGGSAATRFAQYRHGMTVDQARAAGVKNEDFAHDVKKGFIELAETA